MHTRYLFLKPEEANNFEDFGVDGRLIIKLLTEMGSEGVNWIYVVQGRDICRAVFE